MLSYDIVNVFIADGEKFSGNPLAVIYGAEKLTQDQCQALGRRERPTSLARIYMTRVVQ
jgi:predicted PhzF superfamily epimerase YddE/YHI9